MTKRQKTDIKNQGLTATRQSWADTPVQMGGCCRNRWADIPEYAYGKPEIMNTDQGSQYTGAGWITTLTKADIKISMDGRGRYLDNIFIERLWRSLKQEAIYLHEITDGFQAKQIIDDWIGFYNSERPHTALEKQTPDKAYFGEVLIRKAA